MDTMHACDIIPFQWLRKRKERKKTSKDLLYPNTLSHTSPQNLHHTYIYRKNAIPSIIYVPYFALKIILLFIVQFNAHGKVAVHGGVHLCKLYV
jgi:hypothetical protein